MLEVFSETDDTGPTAWRNITQILTDFMGRMVFIRRLSTNSTGVWTYSDWKYYSAPILVTCGTFNNSSVTQSFSIGYSSTYYALIGTKIGTGYNALSTRFVDISLTSNGVVNVTRTAADLYAGQGLYVLLIKIA